VDVIVKAVGTPPGVAHKAKDKVVLPHLLQAVQLQHGFGPVEVQRHAAAAVVAPRAHIVTLAQHVDDAGAGCLGAAYVDVLVPGKEWVQ